MQAPWPRRLPIAFIWALFFNHPLRHFGWIFLLIGGSITHLFVMLADWDTSEFGTREEQGWYLTIGEIVNRESTSTSVDGVPVKQYLIKFTDGRGQEVKFDAYSLEDYGTHTEVDVEYHLESELSPRARNMLRAPLGPYTLLLLIFPLVGMAFAFFGFPTRLKLSRVLSHGELVEGMFKADQISQDQHEQTTYHYQLSYLDQRGLERTLDLGCSGDTSPEELNQFPIVNRKNTPLGILETRVLFLYPKPSDEVIWLGDHPILNRLTLWWDGEKFRFNRPQHHLYSIIIPLVTIAVNVLIHWALS